MCPAGNSFVETSVFNIGYKTGPSTPPVPAPVPPLRSSRPPAALLRRFVPTNPCVLVPQGRALSAGCRGTGRPPRRGGVCAGPEEFSSGRSKELKSRTHLEASDDRPHRRALGTPKPQACSQMRVIVPGACTSAHGACIHTHTDVHAHRCQVLPQNQGESTCGPQCPPDVLHAPPPSSGDCGLPGRALTSFLSSQRPPCLKPRARCAKAGEAS